MTCIFSFDQGFRHFTALLLAVDPLFICRSFQLGGSHCLSLEYFSFFVNFFSVCSDAYFHYSDTGPDSSCLLYSWIVCIYFFYPHPRTFFHCFIERGEGRGKQIWERSIDWLVAFCAWIWNHMCLDQGSNLQPLDHWTMLQPTEPHWPGHILHIFIFFILRDFLDYLLTF